MYFSTGQRYLFTLHLGLFLSAQEVLKTESIRKHWHWVISIFSGQTLYQNNLNNIAFFFTFFKGYRANDSNQQNSKCIVQLEIPLNLSTNQKSGFGFAERNGKSVFNSNLGALDFLISKTKAPLSFRWRKLTPPPPPPQNQSEKYTCIWSRITTVQRL